MSRRRPILQINKSAQKQQKTFGGRSNRFENVVDYSANTANTVTGFLYEGSAKNSSNVDSKVADFMKEIDNIDSSSNDPGDSNADAKVADFLKEIDGIELPAESSSTKQKKSKISSKAASPAIDFGPWKECIDEHTKHPYYWNTLTNEVTWTLPPELFEQYASANSSSPLPSNENTTNVDEKTVPDEMIRKKQSKKKANALSSDTDFHDEEHAAQSDKQNNSSRSNSNRSSPVLGFSEMINSDAADSLNENPDLKSNKDITPSISIVPYSDQLSVEIPKVEEKVYLNKKSQTTPPALCDQEIQADVPSKQKKMSNKAVNTNSDQKIKQKISTLSAVLASKLTFLEISNTNLSDFQILLLEMDVRLRDWKSGQLSDDYVLGTLEAAKDKLKNYEVNAVPPGWSCQWNMQYNRYYYRNNKTNQSQWQYPQSIDAKYHQPSVNDSSSHPGSPISTSSSIRDASNKISDGKNQQQPSTSAPVTSKDASENGEEKQNSVLENRVSTEAPPPPPGEEIPPPLPNTPEDKPPLPPSPSGSIPPPIPPLVSSLSLLRSDTNS